VFADHPPFQPKKLINLPHLQTIGAFLWRGRLPAYKAVKRIVHLTDGDRLVVHDDRPENWITGDRIVILLHGFCGCHQSPYVSRLGEKLARRGFRIIRVDFRGFGDSGLVSRSHLYGGCSHDVDDVIRFVHHLSPLSKISLVGFSLGGNVILKLAGEWGCRPPQYVDSIVAVSPPVDLVYAAWNIRRRGNQVYEAYFMRQVRSQLTMRRRRVKDLVDNGLNPLPNRLVHFDDQFTAPIWGFQGAREYYEKCSSGPLLKDVQVPTVILSSNDDPVVPFDSYKRFRFSNSINLVAPRHGGHLGFISRGLRDPDHYWMDWRICEWIASRDDWPTRI
jgi:predicted alpha/beta-fold hydrolase